MFIFYIRPLNLTRPVKSEGNIIEKKNENSIEPRNERLRLDIKY